MSKQVLVVAAACVATILVSACSGAPVAPESPRPATARTEAPASTPPQTTPVAATATPGASSWGLAAGQLVFEDYLINLDRHQVWIADRLGVRHLVVSAYDDARPSLSPDGRTVLFMRMGDGADHAYLVDVDGTNLRPISCGPDLCDPEGDAWSPDGRTLAIDRAFAPVFIDANGDEEATNVSIWTIGVDGADLTELTKNARGSNREDHRPVWAPDGKQLAFVRTDYAKSPQIKAIFTIRADGTHLHQVTPWSLDANEPDWSPDGSLIAFSAPGASLQPGREQNIFTIRPDGTHLTQLTAHMSSAADGGQGTFDPSWSPDGTQLVFTHIPSFDGLADLYVVNADGSGLHVLARTTDLNESHAVWGVLPTP